MILFLKYYQQFSQCPYQAREAHLPLQGRARGGHKNKTGNPLLCRFSSFKKNFISITRNYEFILSLFIISK